MAGFVDNLAQFWIEIANQAGGQLNCSGKVIHSASLSHVPINRQTNGQGISKPTALP